MAGNDGYFFFQWQLEGKSAAEAASRTASAVNGIYCCITIDNSFGITFAVVFLTNYL